MPKLIHSIVEKVDMALPEVVLRVDRLKLAKRVWRGVAEDGTEFGFELETPLKPGDTVWQAATARYVIAQEPEPVLEVSLDLPASAAAGIGWAVGNLHMELSAEPTRLLAPDDPAVRQLFDRIKIAYRATTAVFRPGRFSRGNTDKNESANHELGPSHRH